MLPDPPPLDSRDGQLVVFEPNPFATLWAAFNQEARYDYQRPCVERLYATLAAFWLERAGLLPDVAKELREIGEHRSETS